MNNEIMYRWLDWLYIITHLSKHQGDFPGGPMVETSPSNPRGLGVIPGQGAELRSHMPVVKKQNRNSIVMNSIKTLQWSTLKKKS